MKSMRKVIFWLAGCIFVLILIGTGSFLLFSIFMEFEPAPVEPVEILGSASAPLDSTGKFSLITWNIGYGGLDNGMDFFYDGGKRVRPEYPSFQQSWAGILHFLKEHDRMDFFLLQEVDSCSKRSFYKNEVNDMANTLPGFCLAYALNYHCRFVPVPPAHPMGRVNSGLVTCSRYQPVGVMRYGFDKHVPWPDRLFYMKRCFLVSRYSLSNGRQLILVNIHNSAYDTGGILRKREMEMIRDFLLAEYERGNYLVAGGDWNANPPGFSPEAITTGDCVKQDDFTNLKSFFPDWEFAFDPLLPTNRDVDQAYRKGITPVTILDFFLVSPNVRILKTCTFPTGFEESDHQPVYLEITLSPAE